jgi:predicted DNA-binding transcriptional regulator AlpA
MQVDVNRKKHFTQRGLAERWLCSTCTFSRMKKRGELPPSIRLTVRIEIWSEDTIEALEASRTGAQV